MPPPRAVPLGHANPHGASARIGPRFRAPSFPLPMRTIAALVLLTVAFPIAAQPAPDAPSTWAQTAKGVRILGGGGSIVRFQNNTSATLSPRVGRFVSDNLAVSASVTLGYSRSTSDVQGTFSNTQFGVGPTVTYYLGNTTGAAPRPFVEGDLTLSYTRFSSDLSSALGNDAMSDTSIGGGLSAGVELPIARNVALRGEAFYQTSDLTFDNDVSFYGVQVGFSTFLY